MRDLVPNSRAKTENMRKIILVCGLISGLIVAATMAIGIAICYKNNNFEGNEVVGYTSMILSFSLIFVGIKNVRDKANGGVISFGKGFLVGLLISLIASTLYVLTWLLMYYNFFPDFMDRYADMELSKLKAAGATVEKISKAEKDMAFFKSMYENPVTLSLVTYMEILPIGIIVSLIAALILRRKRQVA